MEIREVVENEVDLLRSIAIPTFENTYAQFNDPANFATYLKSAFDRTKLLQEIKDVESAYYFCLDNDQIVGYFKINQGSQQTHRQDQESIEIERIYVLEQHKRKGIGAFMIHWVIQYAFKQNKQYVWLGVWEKNVSAISFYKKMGFRQEGELIFQLGDDPQTDYLMIKKV